MTTQALRAPRLWRDYLEITKPKVVALLTFTATVGMLLAAETFPSWTVLVFGSAGIALVSGAAPPLLGWIAVTGQLDPGAVVLFAIVFVWTPPHFWALAIHRRDDYAKVDMPMLPVTHGVPFTRLHILLYTVLLFLFGLFPYLVGISGPLYLIGAVVLGARFLWYAFRMYRQRDDSLAMPTFGYSIVYLFALFAVLLADHYLLLVIQ